MTSEQIGEINELNFTILEFVLPKLKRFREITTSYPATFPYTSMETWLETLDNMIEEIETSIKKRRNRCTIVFEEF